MKTKEITKPTAEEVMQLIADNQEIQKRNPYGSVSHREAYEVIRKALKDYQGHDIGAY